MNRNLQAQYLLWLDTYLAVTLNRFRTPRGRTTSQPDSYDTGLSQRRWTTQQDAEIRQNILRGRAKLANMTIPPRNGARTPVGGTHLVTWERPKSRINSEVIRQPGRVWSSDMTFASTIALATTKWWFKVTINYTGTVRKSIKLSDYIVYWYASAPQRIGINGMFETTARFALNLQDTHDHQIWTNSPPRRQRN